MIPPTPLTRRRWISSAITTCAYLAATNHGQAQSPAVSTPEGYTRPGPAPDHGKAPGMQVRKVSETSGGGATYAVIFAKGDEVLSGLTEFAVHEKIVAGHFTAIGACRRAKFGWFDAAKKAYRDIPVEQQVEVVSLIGDVGIANGKPQVHAHASVALPDGSLRGGHLLEAIVWPTLEVFVTALPEVLAKEIDPETDLFLFDLKAD